MNKKPIVQIMWAIQGKDGHIRHQTMDWTRAGAIAKHMDGCTATWNDARTKHGWQAVKVRIVVASAYKQMEKELHELHDEREELQDNIVELHQLFEDYQKIDK